MLFFTIKVCALWCVLSMCGSALFAWHSTRRKKSKSFAENWKSTESKAIPPNRVYIARCHDHLFCVCGIERKPVEYHDSEYLFAIQDIRLAWMKNVISYEEAELLQTDIARYVGGVRV